MIYQEGATPIVQHPGEKDKRKEELSGVGPEPTVPIDEGLKRLKVVL